MGPHRESNPGPLAPEARIIPLDHAATMKITRYHFTNTHKTRTPRKNQQTTNNKQHTTTPNNLKPHRLHNTTNTPSNTIIQTTYTSITAHPPTHHNLPRINPLTYHQLTLMRILHTYRPDYARHNQQHTAFVDIIPQQYQYLLSSSPAKCIRNNQQHTEPTRAFRFQPRWMFDGVKGRKRG